MERKEIELSSDLILANIEDSIQTDENSKTLDDRRFEKFVIVSDDMESATKRSKVKKFENLLDEKMYGKTLLKQNVPFLPFVLMIVINQFLFHRVCVLAYDENKKEIVKLRTTWKCSRKSADREVLSLYRSLSDRDANHEIFYKMLKNDLTRDGIQDYLYTFPSDFSMAHRKYINKQYSCVVRGNSTFSSTPTKESYIITRIKKPGVYITFVSAFDDGSGLRRRITPFEPLDKSCSSAFQKFERYDSALNNGVWREIYPLYHLFGPDFATDCLKFQDITNECKRGEEPRGLKAGDIILFEKSVFHFDAGIVLKEQGENRFGRFITNLNWEVEIHYYSTWKEFIETDEEIIYVLRMFSMLPFDSPEKILERATKKKDFSSKYLFFNRIYHKTPAEYLAFGIPEHNECPRPPNPLNRIFRKFISLLFPGDEDPEASKFKGLNNF
jgi:hypothetical protein